MMLSTNFSLAELVRSTVASERGIDNTPPPNVIRELEALAQTILQPLRDEFGSLRVTSGYRCPQLNAAVNGSRSSQHVVGQAADVMSMSGVSPLQMATWAWDIGLPFHQCIVEYRGSAEWLHISKANSLGECQRECLTYGDGKYFHGFHSRLGASA